jgi:hypothetical protein
VLALAALPVLYYFALSRIDKGWGVAERADQIATIPWQVLLLCVLPLGLLAIVAGRRAAADKVGRGLLAWPIATLLVVTTTPTGQDRALAGLAVPIAVLIVGAWPARGSGVRRSVPAIVAVATALAGSAYYAVRTLDQLQSPYVTASAELQRSDVRAAVLAGRASHGQPILAPATLGTAIPALTDAASWVGHPIWTPSYGERVSLTSALFDGSMSPATASRLVTSTGSRAIIEPCGYVRPLTPVLLPLGFGEQTIGCARVYTRRP